MNERTPRAPLRRRSRARSLKRERGSVVLWFLFLVAILLTFGAFAVDLPRVTTVRNELQNAADAAALAGAARLTGGTNGPAWADSASAAQGALPLNKVDGVMPASADIRTGYWNLTGVPAGLQATTIVPSLYDAPAVQVTIARGDTQNGGTVSLLMGGLLDLLSAPAAATAVAVAAAPSTVDAGGLFPVVINKCVLDNYWDSATGEPMIDPSTGQAYQFQIGNGQLYRDSCSAGQWTSFLINADDVTTVRGLIQNGNPTPLSVGDSIWIEPGVKDTVYSSVPVGTTVVVPVAAQIDSKSYVPVVAFAAFHVDASYGANSKYILGHFVGGYRIPTQASGAGPAYGAYVAPRLAL